MNPASQQPAASSQQAANAGQQQAQALEFLWKVHGYTNEYIRFADPKAAFAFAVAAGLLAALFTAKCHTHCSPSRITVADASWEATRIGIVSTLAFVCLLAATFLFSWAVAPRLWKVFFKSLMENIAHFLAKHQQNQSPSLTVPPGYIFWDDVLAHQNGGAYHQAVLALTSTQQTEAVAAHVYLLAGIASIKYRWIKWGFRTGFVGAVFAVIALGIV